MSKEKKPVKIVRSKPLPDKFETVLDRRTGLMQPAAYTPQGTAYPAASAEDAFYISIGRPDLAIG